VTLRLANIVFDCDDVLAVATFWSAALETPVDPEATEFFATIAQKDDSVPSWFFAKVPEKKERKNRVHVDLVGKDKEAEIARLIDLGARRVADHDEYGVQWAVLTDPEGNEFCVAQA
jgi:predicted enzyme related to lactoylglutathione lyase